MKVSIVVQRRSEGRWRAKSPAMPGCTAEAATPEAVREGMRQAVAAYISSFDAALPSRIDLVHGEKAVDAW